MKNWDLYRIVKMTNQDGILIPEDSGFLGAQKLNLTLSADDQYFLTSGVSSA